MLQKPVFAHALYDYNRTHTDELSFKKGDIISVSQQLDGGWWEGFLNGSVGWFPSNYVSVSSDQFAGNPRATSDESVLAHLHSFQNEIVQHILEGEVRQVNDLLHLISSVIVHLETFNFLPLLNKIFHMKEILVQAVHLHQDIAGALNAMKQSSDPKRVGKLFLHFAPTVNAVGCDYSKIHLYIITGLDKNADLITRHLSSLDINFSLNRCKQQLSLVFDRLGRYPLLLKEMERYLENPHVDREDIRNAMNVYGEITERCAILRKFKEYDIEILLSTINGWQGPSIEKLGDPVLTLRVTLNDVEQDPMQLNQSKRQFIDWAGRLCVLVTFPSCTLLLARTQHVDTYDFMTRVPLHSLVVIGCPEVETDIDMVITVKQPDRKSICPGRISLSCADRNARDLLLSTLTDLIQYQTPTDMSSCNPEDQCNESVVSQSSSMPDVSGCSSAPVAVNSSDSPGSESNPNSLSAKQTSSPAVSHMLTSDVPHSSHSVTMIAPNLSTSTSTSVSVTPARNLTVINNGSSDPYPVPHSPSVPGSFRFLPHQITTSAHVQWPDKSKNEGPFVPGCIRSIRLDGPLNIGQTGVVTHRAYSFVNLGSGHSSSGLNAASRLDGGVQIGLRPHSPTKGDFVKETRRKKSDRQKSAINVDDVLRSVDKLRNDERRNADAARILQVVEAYCASAWTNVGCRSLDLSQLSLKGPSDRTAPVVLSPRKAFLHGVTAPVKTTVTGTENTVTRIDIKPVSKSGHALLRGPLKFKTNPPATETDSSNFQTPYCAAVSSSNSIVQTMSPPPVVLPTQSGRRF